MLATIQAVTGIDTTPEVIARRPSDPAVLAADVTRIQEVIGWRASRRLYEMVKSAWRARSGRTSGMMSNITAVVAEEWCAVLDADGVGATDNFFECGGDSMRALEFMRRVDSQPGHTFSLQVLFADSGFSDLVSTVRASRPLQ